MKIKFYQVDSFTDILFGGNPAGVCPLDQWLSDDLMQNIAMENNLAETAFFIKTSKGFHIRWFTPSIEVDLCGHATLAAAHVIYNYTGFTSPLIQFESRSGLLCVSKENQNLVLDFPADTFRPVEITPKLKECLGIQPMEAYLGKSDYMLVFSSQQEIESLKPDMNQIENLDARGLIATARGNEVDFVSRFFAPQSGIPEDPVTGSAHTTMAPYWAQRFGKTELSAKQLSKRGGSLKCQVAGDRVKINGQAKTFLIGEIEIDDL